jgi:NAD(P)H dehydrogenase (quinone)
MFVIFGASGKVGHTTATALRRAGHAVRAVVRDAAQGESLVRIGCRIALADLTDATSVARAIDGAHAVQMLCPVARDDPHPADAMRRIIDIAADALQANPPPLVLALSDYGAQLDAGTGITLLFHHLEARFKAAVPRLTLLRSSEHMQNWARVMPVALATGTLPSLHHPVDKPFPFVSAHDVGLAAADLLLDQKTQAGARVVSIEGPRRMSAIDAARALSEASGREVSARALPRSDWTAALLRAGLNENHARLITELYDAQKAGRIDVEAGVGERRFGTTELRDVFAALLPALDPS